MTRLYNDPETFTDDMLAGFVAANQRHVVAVQGGVIRNGGPSDKVAVVIGGGSGHYPAFCGLVGNGFADGAAVGNVFTSPSAQSIYCVARAASTNAGVLLSSGNYAGDVMNFTLAQEMLVDDGIDARVLFVTDDIASAPRDEITKRRGVAGDFAVFKIAGAAAQLGYGIDSVERIARHANARTQSFGVAFDGCTMPGASTPLFELPPGRMSVGLGIHGEPGISDTDLPTAAEVGQLLVGALLDERLSGTDGRVAAILNGLGTTKYEELFVLWRTIAQLLEEAGLTVIEPEVGELVTSLDMAGCSLTLLYLDDELEQLWREPADTSAYRKMSLASPGRAIGSQAVAATPTRGNSVTAPVAGARDIRPASIAAKRAGRVTAQSLLMIRDVLRESEAMLGALDSVAGDGDHGRGMLKGATAAAAVSGALVDRDAGLGIVLLSAGEAWAGQAGGTSGALWGAALQAAGGAFDDCAPSITGEDVVRAARCAIGAAQSLGKAALGDKTLLDAAWPFVDSLTAGVDQGAELDAAWATACRDAKNAADATASMKAKIGRARPLAERGAGSPDPGAVSFALCVHAVLRNLPHAEGDAEHEADIIREP